MTSRFEHSEKANYLVLCTEQREERMADRMLVQNEIKGLLPVRIERINGCKEYYFDISSKHSLGSIVKKGSLNVPKIQLLIQSIGELLRQFHEYMLEPDGICLSEELIYTALPEWKLFFCYYEEDGRKFTEKLRKLLQFVIEYVDYQDKEAVTLAYACYQAAMQDNFTFAKIEDCLIKAGKTDNNGALAETKKYETLIQEEEIKEERLTEKKNRNNARIQLTTEPRIQSEIMEEEVEESSFDAGKAKRISCYIVGGGCLLTGFLWLAATEGIFDSLGLLGEIEPVYYLGVGVGLTLVIYIIWSRIKNQWKAETKLVTKEVRYPYNQKRQENNLENEKQQFHNRQENNSENTRRQVGKEEAGKRERGYKEERNIRENQRSEGYIGRSYQNEECFGEVNSYGKNSMQGVYAQEQKGVLDDTNLSVKNQSREQQKDTEEAEYGKTVLLGYRVDEECRMLFSCQEEYPSIEIVEYPCSIGKIPSLNQVVIAHEGISRIHCSIQKEAGGYSITDRNSTNGVIVNGRRLTPNETVELPIESEIVLGILRYIFR